MDPMAPLAPMPPPRDTTRRGLFATPLATGATSLVLALVALALFAVGIATAFLGFGFLLLLLAIPVGVAAGLLALGSVGTALLGGRGSRRVTGALPGAAALLVLAMMLAGGPPGHRDDGRDRTRPAEAAVRAASAAFAAGDQPGLCRLLDPAARTPGCPRHPPLCRTVDRCGNLGQVQAPAQMLGGDPVAVVVYTLPLRPLGNTDQGPHQVRVRRHGQTWLLLDVPGLPNRCVDTKIEPMSCPILRR